MATLISLRPPTTVSLSQPQTFTPPSLAFLSGTWHVTHSTLPMWKSKRNVSITYKPIPSPDSIQKIDDIVQYQTLSSPSIKTVQGIDTIAAGRSTGEWDWRGKGWLKIASSHWEVLGWGEGEGEWVVTYFAKTLFTPAGVDVYSRAKEGHSEEMVKEIKEALVEIEDEGVRRLAGELFEVVRDGGE